MRDFQLKLISSRDILYQYPCINPLSGYLKEKEIWVLNAIPAHEDMLIKIKALGGEVKVYDHYEYIHDTRQPSGGIILPPSFSREDNTVDAYYGIMDYYIKFSQMMVHKMSGLDRNSPFRHLLLVLPFGSSQCSSMLGGMAYYAMTGLVAGLGKMYGNKGLFCAGLELGENTSHELVSEWISYLMSDNSNNTIGELIKL